MMPPANTGTRRSFFTAGTGLGTPGATSLCMSRNKKRESVLGRLLVVAAAGTLTGCSAPSQTDYSSIRGLSHANAPALAAVFSPDGALPSTPGWESTRRDAALGVQSHTPRLAIDAWPTDPRPNLRTQRRGRLTTDSRSYLYFETEPDRPGFRRGW
jgi:hypothetical protein